MKTKRSEDKMSVFLSKDDLEQLMEGKRIYDGDVSLYYKANLAAKGERCPVCGTGTGKTGRCSVCPSCGWSSCPTL